MKKTTLFFTFLFICSILQAQSLAEITAQKDFVMRTPQPAQEETLIDTAEEQNTAQQGTQLQVNKLPDIKLNEDIVKKSVISYNNNPDLQEAFEAYTQGDIDKSLLLLEANSSPEANANSALIYLQMGDFKKSLNYINKAMATEESQEEPIYQLIKIWIYAAQNNYTQTEKEYQKLLFLTADFEYIYNAKLALVTAAFFAKKYKQIAPLLENIYGSNPYAISHAAYLIGRVLFNEKSYKSAQTLLSQALVHDNNNYPALVHYGLTQEKLKEFIPAWQSFANILILDSNDKFALNKTKQLSKYLKNRPNAYLFYTKLDEIYTKEPSSSKSELVRIGLYSDKEGSLQSVKEFMFNAGQDFVIEDEKLGIVLSGQALSPKTIVFNPETNSIDINNKWGHKEFSTKRPFALKMQNNGSTFLVKDPITDNIFTANLSDKELKGVLLVIPENQGMKLINYTTLEDILPAILTQFSKGQKNPDTLQALAIVLRTQIANMLRQTTDALFDLPDNTKDFYYGGINMQSAGNIEAVKNTENQILTELDSNTPALPKIYQSCSYLTAEGIKNTEQKVDYTFSPLNLFKYMISNPPKDLISAPQDPTQWANIKWIYMIPVKEMQNRINFAFKNILPAQTDIYGRIKEISFKTSNKAQTLPFKEANQVLALGTLRSDFFFYIPVNKGQEYLFLGTDTGLGEGLCVDGLKGLTEQDKSYMEALKYYYPNLKVSDKWQNKKSLL